MFDRQRLDGRVLPPATRRVGCEENPSRSRTLRRRDRERLFDSDRGALALSITSASHVYRRCRPSQNADA
jgi:hypothetical protein